MGIKHASIAIVDIGARAIHTGIQVLREQALSIGTSTHGRGLASFTKDIDISSTGLFGSALSKAVVKSASTSRNYKALVVSFVLSGLPRPKFPPDVKQKSSSSSPFDGKGQSQNWQSSASSAAKRLRLCSHMRRSAGLQAGMVKQP